MSGIYAADGSINVTVVAGNAITGLYAANGSMNVVCTDGLSITGVNAPCGARNVFLVTSGIKGAYAPNGAWNVAESPYTATGARRVTAVSGTLV